MQPFPNKNSVLALLPDFFFRPGKKFEVSVWKGLDQGTLDAWNPDAFGCDGSEDRLISKGIIVLGESIFVDT